MIVKVLRSLIFKNLLLAFSVTKFLRKLTVNGDGFCFFLDENYTGSHARSRLKLVNLVFVVVFLNRI